MMTEEDWLAATDPMRMLNVVRNGNSDRKLRLFVCAWASDYWPLLPDDGCEAVHVAEQYADGSASSTDLLEAFWRARAASAAADAHAQSHRGRGDKTRAGRASAMYAAGVAALAADPELVRNVDDLLHTGSNWATQYSLACRLRDIFGNPFRPVALDPSWLTSTVAALARGIYANRAFDRLPILADALQDAGCDHADVLDHCRSDGPHVRGCWVVDLVLGLS